MQDEILPCENFNECGQMATRFDPHECPDCYDWRMRCNWIEGRTSILPPSVKREVDEERCRKEMAETLEGMVHVPSGVKGFNP